MTKRKSIDCRWFPSDNNCTLALSGSEEEVLEVSVHHAITAHSHENTPELKEQIRSLLRDVEEEFQKGK